MKVFFGAVTILSITGCSPILVSNHIKPDIPQTSAIEGIIYSLPKRMHRLKVSGKLEDESNLQGKLESAIQNLKNAEDKVKQLKQTMIDAKSLASNTPAGKAKDDADKLAQAAEGAYKVVQVAAIAAQDAYDNINDVINKSRQKPNSCVYSFTMTVTPQDLVPDPEYTYSAKLNHSIFHDDDFAIKTTTTGLLSGSNVTSTDRTGDILIEIAKAVATFGVGGFSGSVPTYIIMGSLPSAKSKDCEKSSTYNETVDFAKTPHIDLQFKTGSDSVYVHLQTVSKKNLTIPKSASDIENGLLYRREMTYIVQLKTSDKLLAEELITMPNYSPISVIPADSRFLTTAKYESLFENGMLTSDKANTPSEALAAVSLPATVAKAMLSVVTDVFKLRFDNTKSQTDLVDQQTKYLEAIAKFKKTQDSSDGSK